MARPSRFSEEQILEMYNKYINGDSSIKIAKEYNTSASTIMSLFKSRKMSTRNCSVAAQKYKVDNTFFSDINTEEKAYWLGFIYADGYISTVNKRNTFGIALALKDIKHLEKLKNSINSTHPIKIYKQSNGYIEGQEYCKLTINNKELISDLRSQGVVENKTNIITAPTINASLASHFIRGYMDGDGCISYNSQRDEYSIKILGTNDILNYISDFIEDNLCISVNPYTKRKKDQTVSCLEMCGNIQSLKFLNAIYKNATICLDRKYLRYKNLCNKYSVEPNGNIGC